MLCNVMYLKKIKNKKIITKRNHVSTNNTQNVFDTNKKY